MTKARGSVQAFDPSQVTGIDTRIWQEQGTSSDNRGVYFSLKGEVVTAEGIRPLVRSWKKVPKRHGLPTHYSVNPFPRMITSIGTFENQGTTDILIECDGKISLIQGEVVTDIIVGRHIPKNLSEATRFIQVSNNLIILNGRDPNMKWDGEKVTPLGIAGFPEPPLALGDEDGATKISIFEPRGGLFWSGHSMLKTSKKVKYRYKMSWISEFGQESELSPGSNVVDDDNVVDNPAHRYLVMVAGLEGPAPQDDIIGRNLYRSLDGITYWLIRYLPGTDGDTYLDTIDPEAPLSEEAPEPLENRPPPLCRFAFYFRGRTYYAGSLDNPTVLYYSKDKAGKEAVPVDNFLLIGTNGADKITGFAISADFVLIFKENSTFMLTQDKDGKPILTPMSGNIGAVSDRAAVGFEGKVYFVSKSGINAFDGTKVVPISKDISEIIRKIPSDTLKNSIAWVDPANRRVYFSIAAGPKSYNNEVWAIHVDNGALSRVEAVVTAAARYKDMVIVGYSSHVEHGPVTPSNTVTAFGGTNVGKNELGVWGAGSAIYYFDSPTGVFTPPFASDGKTIVAHYPPLLKVPMRRSFETRWIYASSPQSDKTFYRIDVFYVQTGGYQIEDRKTLIEGFDNRLYVKWFTDWDRNIIGEDYLTPADPDALLWDGAKLDALGAQVGPLVWSDLRGSVSSPSKLWDEKRVRCKKINIRVTDPLDPLDHLNSVTRPDSQIVNTESDQSGENITAKSLKISFDGGGDAGWRIVGFLLHMKDHGIRGEGTDHE